MTRKEFDLLEYLMSYPEKALSRVSILEQVWGYHYDTLTNIVDVYIGYLRKNRRRLYEKADSDRAGFRIQDLRKTALLTSFPSGPFLAPVSSHSYQLLIFLSFASHFLRLGYCPD